jgi:hypothetical protein
MAGARPATDVGRAPGAVGWTLGMATTGCGDAGEPGAGAGVASTVAGAADDEEEEEEEEEDAAPGVSARLTTLSPHLAVEADGSW